MFGISKIGPLKRLQHNIIDKLRYIKQNPTRLKINLKNKTDHLPPDLKKKDDKPPRKPTLNPQQLALQRLPLSSAHNLTNGPSQLGAVQLRQIHNAINKTIINPILIREE